MKNIFKEFIDDNYGNTILPKNRLNTVFIFLILIFFILCGKLLYVSTFRSKSSAFQFVEEKQNIKKRNNIVDRNNVIIASDIDLVNFYLNRELITNPKRTVDIITHIMPEVNAEKLYSKLISTTNKAKYILVKKNITPKQQVAIKESGILGFEFNNSVGRIYPHKNLFSHIVG